MKSEESIATTFEAANRVARAVVIEAVPDADRHVVARRHPNALEVEGRDGVARPTIHDRRDHAVFDQKTTDGGRSTPADLRWWHDAGSGEPPGLPRGVRATHREHGAVGQRDEVRRTAKSLVPRDGPALFVPPLETRQTRDDGTDGRSRMGVRVDAPHEAPRATRVSSIAVLVDSIGPDLHHARVHTRVVVVTVHVRGVPVEVAVVGARVPTVAVLIDPVSHDFRNARCARGIRVVAVSTSTHPVPIEVVVGRARVAVLVHAVVRNLLGMGPDVRILVVAVTLARRRAVPVDVEVVAPRRDSVAVVVDSVSTTIDRAGMNRGITVRAVSLCFRVAVAVEVDEVRPVTILIDAVVRDLVANRVNRGIGVVAVGLGREAVPVGIDGERHLTSSGDGAADRRIRIVAVFADVEAITVGVHVRITTRDERPDPEQRPAKRSENAAHESRNLWGLPSAVKRGIQWIPVESGPVAPTVPLDGVYFWTGNRRVRVLRSPLGP
ncbi:MAG: hypothetical protein R3B99_00175 [Polyangiales bacterium]